MTKPWTSSIPMTQVQDRGIVKLTLELLSAREYILVTLKQNDWNLIESKYSHEKEI